MSFNSFAQEKETIKTSADTTIKKYNFPSNYSNTLFTSVQIESEFNGGSKGWQNFLVKNLDVSGVRDKFKRKEIPKEGLKLTTEVTFTVCSDGSVCDFQVDSNAHPFAKEEVLRVMKLSPNWLPGIQDGIKVKSRKKQRITFMIIR